MTRRPPRPSGRTAADPGASVTRGRLVYVVTPQGTRCVGRIVTDPDSTRALECRRNAGEQLLRSPRPAWAVAVDALEQAADAGCTVIRIVTRDGCWPAPLALLRDRPTWDRGHGEQVSRPLDMVAGDTHRTTTGGAGARGPARGGAHPPPGG